MPRCKCPKHGPGLQFMCCVCPEVAAAIAEQRELRFSTIEHPDLSWLWLCGTCAADLASSGTDEKLEEFTGRLTVVCSPCANEWRGRGAEATPGAKA